MNARLYQKAVSLFSQYPLATRAFANSPSAVMALVDGEDTYTLHWGRTGVPHPFITLFPWGSDDEELTGELVVDASGATEIRGSTGPVEAEGILARSTPFPRDSSLLGWVDEGTVTALVACYADADLNETGRPGFALMPRHGVPQGQWPPITPDFHPQFGEWFWDYQRASRLVDLASLIAATPGAVSWVADATPLGTSICAVAWDIQSPGGYTLPGGYYAYYKALQQGMPDPHLLVKRRGPGIDLAPRFQWRAAGGAR